MYWARERLGSPSRWLSATAAASARRRQAKRVRRPWSAAASSAKRVVATRQSRPGCGWVVARRWACAARAGRSAAGGRHTVGVELLIARNPDPDSTLPYLLRVPIGADGLLFRTKGTWPRTSALYCHPVALSEWPERPEIVERIPLKTCARRGAAIDVVADRGREQRSQIVFTSARGRAMVFWQSPRTRRQARPDVRLPTARAAGVAELEIVVDAHERYAYTFAGQQVRTVTPRLGLRGLRDQRRREARRRGRAQVAARPGVQPDQRPAALRARRAGDAAARRGRRGGPLLAGLHARASPSRAGRRRPGRAAGPLADDPDRVLRDPQAGTRNGPTATSPPRSAGPRTNCPRSLGSAPATRTPRAPRRNPRRAAPKFARGRARTGSAFPTAADCTPRSTRPGTTPTTPERRFCRPRAPARRGCPRQLPQGAGERVDLVVGGSGSAVATRA